MLHPENAQSVAALFRGPQYQLAGAAEGIWRLEQRVDAVLANSLETTPIHLNRVLKAPRAKEAMTMTRGNLLITDPSKLVQVAGFDENYLHRRLRRAA